MQGVSEIGEFSAHCSLEYLPEIEKLNWPKIDRKRGQRCQRKN